MLATMLMGVSAAAQAPEGVRRAMLITEVPPPPSGPRGRSPLAVIERLMSFDANADRRISRDELPERMQGLVARGDTNADAALDSDEIRALTTAASSGRAGFLAFRTPSSDGLSGVIRDLKLSPAKHERALAIAQAHTGNVSDPVRGELDGQMRALLDDEEDQNFLAAARRLSRHIGMGTVGGVVGGLQHSPAPARKTP